MNKFWIILRHTYMTRVKTKMFIIATIIPLLLIIGFANFQSIKDIFTSGGKDQVAVIDQTDGIGKKLRKNFHDEDVKLIDYDGDVKKGKKAVQDETYIALLVLSQNDKKLPTAAYYTNNGTTSQVEMVLKDQLQQLKIALATNQAGIDASTLKQIYAPINFETVALDKHAKTDEELSQTRGIVYIMLMLLYVFVLLYGQMIAMDVATEKTSRVMEILISSVSPVKQMLAKIVGIALLGLTQIGLIAGLGYGVIQTKKDGLTDGIFSVLGISGATPSLFVYAIVFFVLGYFLYATLAAMLGSLVSRIEDVQQLMLPMMFFVIAALFISMYGLTAPESGFVTICSYIPFFSPMVMFLRVGMLDVATWQILLSLVILISTIILFAIMAARIYKGGVLMYGKSSSLKDIKQALSLSKKESK